MTTLSVAAVQTDPVFGEVVRNTDAALALVPQGCDLAVLPELFATGYQFGSADEARGLAEAVDDPRAPSLARLRAFAGDTGTAVAAGLCERVGDRVFNSAVLVTPDGHLGLYRKVHLFWDEKDIFSPGDLGFPVFAACGLQVGLMICFDWAFPEAARSLVLGGARLILHPSNLVLPWCQEAMRTRCLENRVPAVTANRVGTECRTGAALAFSGMSQVVSARGEVLQRLAAEGTGAATAMVTVTDEDRLLTPRNDVLADRRPDQYRL
ncbi:MAG TPA: nitrilase-related carbon-nitrogen hydrolase [Candidatus Krumholzibacteria bacterium]|nr:nitrilase-related carbon-nitrogen hydrolase [Candidatus Krumholzibacteria bacterium]